MKTVKFGRSCGRRGTGRVCAWIFSHTRGRRASSVLCVPSTRGERSSAVPHPPGSPRYPRDSLGTASPLPAGLHRLPGRGEAAGAADRPSLHPRGLPQHSAAGAESPSAGAWDWGSRGAPPRSPPGTPQPRFPLSRSAAWPPCSRSPFSSADREFSHHPLAEAGMSPRTAFPNAGIPRLPGTPGPPGIPFPSAGSSGVCTHPLPAAVALSLETGSDSGSITFSALSLSGNFCGNPSEIGG